jgi:hypothetical protein
LQLNIEAEYYEAGDAFTADVTVDYSRMFERFHAAAGAQGFFTSAQAEALWQKEGLCLDRRPEDCGIKVKLKDGRGREIENVSLDPDSEDGKLVWQAVQRLVDQIQKDMLTPIGQALSNADSSKPWFGFKVDAKYEKQQKGMTATFHFASPRGVNKGKTVIPTGIACVRINDQGDVSRYSGGDCSHYWEGSYGFQDILAAEASKIAGTRR